MKLILIKLGGSVITNKAKLDTPNIKNINRLFREIHTALNKQADKNIKIIIGHGSGSFGHFAANKYQVHKGLINKESLKGTSITQDSAARLHRIIFNQALLNKLNILSFSPSSAILSNNSKIISWNLKLMQNAINFGFIPLTYGDISIDLKTGVSIVSTEEVFRYIAYKLKPYKIIVTTDVDGVLDNNKKLITNISKINFNSISKKVNKSKNIDVTGGMKSKLDYLYKISKEVGTVCEIINANNSNRLYNSILNKKTIGTKIKY